MLWIFTYRFLCEQKCSFLWNICARMQLLIFMVSACLICQRGYAILYSQQHSLRGLGSQYGQQYLVLLLFFTLAVILLCSDILFL